MRQRSPRNLRKHGDQKSGVCQNCFHSAHTLQGPMSRKASLTLVDFPICPLFLALIVCIFCIFRFFGCISVLLSLDKAALPDFQVYPFLSCRAHRLHVLHFPLLWLHVCCCSLTQLCMSRFGGFLSVVFLAFCCSLPPPLCYMNRACWGWGWSSIY